MSVQVKCFEEHKAKLELKKCPKIVRDYVKLIERSANNWKGISEKAIINMHRHPIGDDATVDLIDTIIKWEKELYEYHTLEDKLREKYIIIKRKPAQI